MNAGSKPPDALEEILAKLDRIEGHLMAEMSTERRRRAQVGWIVGVMALGAITALGVSGHPTALHEIDRRLPTGDASLPVIAGFLAVLGTLAVLEQLLPSSIASFYLLVPGFLTAIAAVGTILTQAAGWSGFLIPLGALAIFPFWPRSRGPRASDSNSPASLSWQIGAFGLAVMTAGLFVYECLLIEPAVWALGFAAAFVGSAIAFWIVDRSSDIDRPLTRDPAQS